MLQMPLRVLVVQKEEENVQRNHQTSLSSLINNYIIDLHDTISARAVEINHQPKKTFPSLGFPIKL